MNFTKGFDMNIYKMIERHKQGEVNFRQMGEPKITCTGDDQYIAYLNYCWEFLIVVGSKIDDLEFLVIDDAITIGNLCDDAKRAHAIIERCHKLLNITPSKNYIAPVFTTTTSHERELGRR
tara:strand:- start:30064 stop:30426 length:363 start_codon:yes stop_codon:yes gene_type:complete